MCSWLFELAISASLLVGRGAHHRRLRTGCRGAQHRRHRAGRRGNQHRLFASVLVGRGAQHRRHRAGRRGSQHRRRLFFLLPIVSGSGSVRVVVELLFCGYFGSGFVKVGMSGQVVDGSNTLSGVGLVVGTGKVEQQQQH